MALKPETDAISGVATTGHEWDGIKELDNPMPAWWIYTFYACIAFAAVWVIFYPSLPFVRGTLGYTGRGDFEAAMEVEKAKTAPMLARMRAAKDLCYPFFTTFRRASDGSRKPPSRKLQPGLT